VINVIIPRRQTAIHCELKDIIVNVIEKCNEEKTWKQLLSLSKATKQAAIYIGVSSCTVKKIRGEYKTRKEKHLDNHLAFSGKKKGIIMF
jgi:hypothetical protein